MQVRGLAPGSLVSGLVVELVALHGAAASKSNCSSSTVYRATVRDATGLCTLIYRPGPKCNPAGVRKGHTYSVTGHVTLEQGHIVLEAGGSTGALERTHATLAFSHEQSAQLLNYSAQQHVHAVLLQRSKQQQLQAYLTSATGSTSNSTSSSSNSKQLLLLQEHPLPAGIVTGPLPGPAAACRVLEHALQLNPESYQLLPLPPAAVVLPAAESSSSSDMQVVHVYCAVLNQGHDQMVSKLGRDAGQWVPVTQLQQQQQHDMPEQQQQYLRNKNWQAAVQLLLGCCRTFIPSSSSSSVDGSAQNQQKPSSSKGSGSSSSGHQCELDHLHGAQSQQEPVQAEVHSTTAAAAAEPAAAAAAAGACIQSPEHPLQHPLQQQQQQSGSKKLPVTLLSGFLGAGKTTLLKHLLRTASPELRIAVVVNDVAALNIDSALIKGGGLVQSQEQLVELQNGCICCSLRMDLVQAVAQLAAAGRFDLLLLESTGVSEPLQVAEIFSADVPIDLASSSSNSTAAAAAAAGAVAAAGSDTAAAAVLLRDVAYLDTAVTVVDAHQLMHNLHSIHTFRGEPAEKSGRGEDSTTTAAAAAAAQAELSGSHRHIAELLLDQIETADVLILNKADTVSQQEVIVLQAVLAALNPSAKLLTTTNSVVNPSEVFKTGLWSTEKAQGSAAWVQLLRQNHEHGAAVAGVTSATGVTSYTADGDAVDRVQHQHSHHHEHLGEAGHGSCCCTSDALGSSHGVTSTGVTTSCSSSGAGGVTRSTADYGVSHFVYRARWPFHPGRLHQFMVKYFVLQEPDWDKLMQEDEQEVHSEASESGSTDHKHQQQQSSSYSSSSDARSTAQQLQQVAASRRAAFESQFGMLLRSKGFAWLATRGDHIGEWSQAGSLLSFSTGGPWFCVLPRDAWPADEQQQAEIRADFAPGVGDRRQELVFIGLGLKQAALRAALDECLVRVEEAEGLGFGGLEDPFEPWPDVEDMIDAGDVQDDDDYDYDYEEEVEEAEVKDASAAAAATQQQHMQPAAAAAAAAAEAADSTAAAAATAAAAGDSVWHPGRVNVIMGGAPQLQQLLDDIMDKHSSSSSSTDGMAATAAASGPAVVIEWVAPWAAASLEASKQAVTLAVTFPHIPFITVDVTASDANRQLALEKVMEVPQAYRKGGRKFQPVPKSGEKWPCVTLHFAPLLHPSEVFSGTQAGQQLLQQLQQLGLLSRQPTSPAAAAAVQGRQPAAAAAAAGGVEESKAQPAAQQSAVPVAHRPAAQQQAVSQVAVQQLKKGATDLKLLLQQAGSTGLLLLLWTDSSSSSSNPLCAELPTLLLQHSTQVGSSSRSGGRVIIVAAAETAASQANSALATALKALAQLPVVQIFHNKQLVKMVKLQCDISAAEAVRKVEQAVLQLQLLPVDTTRQQQQQQQQQQQGNASSKQQLASSSGQMAAPTAAAAAATDSAASEATTTCSSEMAATTAAPAAATTPTASEATTTTTTSSSSSDLWDPPTGKAAKPGSKKKFPAAAVYNASSSSSSSSSSSVRKGSSSSSTVSAVFWPRMPCLSCGCPWWLGEDWDAACARCGWTCEDDGYDDNSNPLPEYKERYSMITAVLKQGRTPSDLAPLE